MPIGPILIFISSIIMTCYATWQLISRAVSAPEYLITDYHFWFWALLAWVFMFLVIRNYIVIREKLAET